MVCSLFMCYLCFGCIEYSGNLAQLVGQLGLPALELLLGLISLLSLLPLLVALLRFIPEISVSHLRSHHFPNQGVHFTCSFILQRIKPVYEVATKWLRKDKGTLC